MPALTAATLDIGANGQYKAAQGIITADKPAISITATLNSGATAFTVIKANVTDTASAAASLLIDLQVGGVSQFKVSKAGALTAAAGITATTGTFSGAVTLSSTLAVAGTSLLGTGAISANTSSGDVVVGNMRDIKSTRTDGVTTYSLIRLDNADVVEIARESNATKLWGTVLATGAVTLSSTLAVTQNITASGGVRYGHEETRIESSDNTATGALRLISGGGERIRLPNTGQVLIGTTVTTGSAAGELALANDKDVRGVIAAGTASRRLIGLDTSDRWHLGDDAVSVKGRISFYDGVRAVNVDAEITTGAADSAGAGYRALRVPN